MDAEPPPPAATPGAADPAPRGPVPAAAPPVDRRTPPLPELAVELRDLVVTYVKQQTLVPLQQLGRYVGFGLGGSLLLGFGVVFLAMAALRALQTETGDTFTGDWSWVPYVIVIVALALGGALVWLVRGASRARKEARS
jgi:hypothetical protein